MLLKLKNILSHQGFMKYFKNTSWLMGEKILRMTVGLFVGVWVARYLGPEQFGLFSYAQSFVGLFAIISSFGLDSIVVRELVKDEARKDELLGTSFVLKVVGALLTLIVLGIAVNFTSNDSYTNRLVFIIASATVFQSFNVIDLYFQSRVLSKYVVYANIFCLFISSIIKIMLILNEAPLEAFAWMVLFDTFILASGLVYFYFTSSSLKCRGKSVFHTLSIRFRKDTAIALLKDSWPLALGGAALMVQAYIDQVMLKEMMGSEAVGYYSVAVKIIAFFGFVPVVLSSSLAPAIFKAKNINVEIYESRLENFYKLNFCFFLITAIPIFLYSETIIQLLFGSEYYKAGSLLALMSLRLFFASFGTSRSVYLAAENLMKYSLLSLIAGSFVNVVLNYYWIAEYGAEGAILATLCSFFTTTFLIDAVYSKTRKNVILQIKGVLYFYRIRGVK